jgi:hypothetical protein
MVKNIGLSFRTFKIIVSVSLMLYVTGIENVVEYGIVIEDVVKIKFEVFTFEI